MNISTSLAVILLVASLGVQAQCVIAPEHLAAMDASAPPSVVIAGPDEPGERLVVEGRVIDGTDPVGGALIFVFHADANGFYAPGRPDAAAAESNPRLHGALRTGADGRYRFETIRPGGYDGIAAHIHYVVRAPGYKTRLFEVQFQDDPILVARLEAGEPQIPQSLRNSPCFKSGPDVIAIRPVKRDAAGVSYVVRDLDMFPE